MRHGLSCEPIALVSYSLPDCGICLTEFQAQLGGQEH